MRRYTFVTPDNGTVLPDIGEPHELPDIESAWHEATKYVGETLRDMDGALSPKHQWRLEVREDGKPERARAGRSFTCATQHRPRSGPGLT
jgi:hypothetical protein